MRYALGLALLAALFALPAFGQETPCVDGQAGVFACANVDLVARLPLNATPEFLESSSDIWGWTDPQTGTEYAIINQYDHTAFVDLSDPAAPFVVGRLTAPALAVARDAKVYADHAIIGTDRDEAPVQIFDLTRLRDVTSPPVEFDADATYDLGLGPHNVTIDTASGYAYLTGRVVSDACPSSLHIVDVRVPTAPVYGGCYVYPNARFHDAQCLTYDGPDPDYQGDELCFGAAGNGEVFTVVNVTDKSAPLLISEVPYPNADYTHQGWLTEDGRYFLANDEGDEGAFGINTRTLVFDMQDLDNPQFAFAYDHPTTATDHNLFVKGDYAYQANYTAGLRILDLTGLDDDTLTEVAYFDTHPEGDPIGFDGAFGVYPYFDSGIVVVSDMARGLFVLRPTLDAGVGVEPAAPRANGFTLSAYPNPFTDSTQFTLNVEETQRVTVAVYDVFGRPVETLFEGVVPADDPRTLRLNGAALAAGSYVVRVTGETFKGSRSVTLVR